jgi:uncharacterized protein (TIGR02231 family)
MQNHFYSALLAGVSLLALSPVHAAEIAANSRIESVVVYNGVAAITRVVEADVPAGAHTILVTGLPQAVDPNSLRIEGAAIGQLQIGSVEMQTQPLSAQPANTEVAARMQKLMADRDKRMSEISALTSKQAMIKAIGEQSPQIFAGKDKTVDPAEWAKAWDAVGQGLAKVADDLREANAGLKLINEEIQAIGRQSGGGPRAGLTRAAHIAVEAAGGAKATLKLTYNVSGANWRPSYDATLTTASATPKPKLSLVRRAIVTQRTGEDWKDVTLSVSTAQPLGTIQAPDVPPVRVGFNEPPVIDQSLVRRRQAPAAMPNAISSLRVDQAWGTSETAAPMAEQAPAPVAQKQAQLQVTGYSAQFIVPGKISVSPDGNQRSFRLGSRDIEPTLGVKTAPAFDAKAYLELRFMNDEDAPLMAGQVSLTRDGVFVGQGQMKQVASGDSVEMGFGVDDKVKVSRVPVRRRETEASWTQGQRGELREFKTTIKNLHSSPMKITVLDQIPYSENNMITVEALPSMTQATEKTVQDKRGVMGWTYDYKPGEEKEIRTGYRIRFPNDRELIFEPQPIAR